MIFLLSTESKVIIEVGVDVEENHADNIMDACHGSMVVNGLIWEVHFQRLRFRCPFFCHLKVNAKSKTSRKFKQNISLGLGDVAVFILKFPNMVV